MARLLVIGLCAVAAAYEERRWHRELEPKVNSTKPESKQGSKGGEDKNLNLPSNWSDLLTMPGIVLNPRPSEGHIHGEATEEGAEARVTDKQHGRAKHKEKLRGKHEQKKRDHPGKNLRHVRDKSAHEHRSTKSVHSFPNENQATPNTFVRFSTQVGNCREGKTLKFHVISSATDIPANCQELCRQDQQCVAFDVNDDDIDEKVRCQFYRHGTNSELGYIGDGKDGFNCFILHARKGPHFNSLSSLDSRASTSPVLRRGAQNELRRIVDAPYLSSQEKLEGFSNWLSKQKPEDVDALWPRVEHSLRDAMGSQEKWATVAVAPNMEAETDATRDRSAFIVAALAGSCVVLGVYFVYITKNRDGTVRIPLISMDGYSDSLEG